jgi:hypothetical protein
MNKPYTARIFIVIQDSKHPLSSIPVASASESGIDIWDQSILLDTDDKIRLMLRHEMTHVIMFSYYRLSDSLLFTEGIAEYIANNCGASYDAFGNPKIADYFSIRCFSHFNINIDELWDIYETGGHFIKFWCLRYGLENFYSLYGEITTSNYRTVIEKYGMEPFDTIIGDFITW